MPTFAGHEIAIQDANQAIYNAYDTMLTFEVDQHRQSLRRNDDLIYRFERQLQAPVLEMMMRGFRVDISEREKAVGVLNEQRGHTTRFLSSIIEAIQGTTYNDKFPNSPKQLQALFYDCMKLPPIETHRNGETKRPMDRETLEKLELSSKWVQPIINAILLHRDQTKALQVLETEIDNDWRWRCSYNIGGTTTGRFSSSKSPFGTGNNFQNITEELRRVFIPDPGFKLYGIDRSQSESRDVGFFCGVTFGDWSYLDACESGDLHTYVTRLLYPDWDWTGNLKEDRKIAERRFYRLFTFRDASKRLGHACITEDHEVLTPNGWVPITDKPEIIMQFEKNSSRFVKVWDWTDDPSWTGKLYTWEGQAISVTMNETHKVLYTTTDKFGLKFAEAPKVPKSARIPSGWGWIGDSTNKLSPATARLIAAYQCDGYKEGNRIRFHFHKDRKFIRLKELAEKAEIEWLLQEGDRMVLCVENCDWPKKAGSYLLAWNIEALSAYLDELPYWDGHFSETAVNLSSVDRDHLDWIKTCNRLVGKGGNVHKKPLSGFGSQTYTLQINNREYVQLSNIEFKNVEQKTTRVLCPTIPSGAFYIRRNGKISVTGNTNYLGTPKEISRQTRIPENLAFEFQKRYFAAFPCIPRMHAWIAQQIQRERYLVNSFGRRRDIFDRPETNDTLKAAVAYMFQSATGDALNLGMLRLWQEFRGGPIQLLSQLHDAVYFQMPIMPERDERDYLKKALACIQITQTYKDRKMTTPGEIVGGFNWAHRYRLLEDGTKEDWNPRGLDGIRLD